MTTVVAGVLISVGMLVPALPAAEHYAGRQTVPPSGLARILVFTVITMVAVTLVAAGALVVVYHP